jgi:MFS family permease
MLHMISHTLKTAWPLFFGLFMIMMGNGLQGTLLGVRASIEEFPTWLTGLIMSFYFIGFLGGTIMVPKFVRNVGHIRTFAALASLASTTVLLHGVFIDPIGWLPVRLLTGFSFSGLYIVVESWLNNEASNKTRGTMMAIYLVVNYLGIMLGQILLNVADPGNIELFIVVSVLVSLALVPISLSTKPAPEFEKLTKMPLKKLFKTSPLGVSSVFQTGFATAALFTILPVYASQSGSTTAQVSFIMILIMLGAMLFQIPVGWLSDQMDRRKVIIGTTAVTAFFTFAAYMIFGVNQWGYYAVLFLFGGGSMSMYGLSVSHANDHVEQDEIVAVSSSMLLVNGIGACFGPILVSTFMQILGNELFFPIIGVSYVLLFAFGLYRSVVKPSIPLDDQGDYVAMPVRSSQVIYQMIEDEEGETGHS